jgi:hypothetical protein
MRYPMSNVDEIASLFQSAGIISQTMVSWSDLLSQSQESEATQTEGHQSGSLIIFESVGMSFAEASRVLSH